MGSDWATSGDYDVDGAVWINATRVGADYQHEINAAGTEHRHRLNTFGSAWQAGPPPTNKEEQ